MGVLLHASQRRVFGLALSFKALAGVANWRRRHGGGDQNVFILGINFRGGISMGRHCGCSPLLRFSFSFAFLRCNLSDHPAFHSGAVVSLGPQFHEVSFNQNADLLFDLPVELSSGDRVLELRPSPHFAVLVPQCLSTKREADEAGWR